MHNLIPHFIYEQYQSGKVNGSLQAITLFLDMSGFTPVTQKLMAHGKEGAELLADIINRVFDPTINAVYERGGFIIGFAGDAFTAVFPHHNKATAIAACAAAIAIRQTFVEQSHQQTKLGDFTLAIKQGLSAGEVEWGIVGSDEHKMYFFRGEAIEGCAESEHQAKRGDIVLDNRLQALLPMETAVLLPLDNQFAQLAALKELFTVIPSPAPSAMINIEIMAQFFPETVWKMSQQGEFRYAATLFISFQGPDSIQTLDHFMRQAMNLVHRFNGFFAEIDFVDKDGVFIIYFGAPITHENDVKRALDFIHTLQEVETNIIWRAGISSGIVYAGYVGTSRRDKYACMGSVMNLSARMMAQAAWGEVLTSSKVALHPKFNFTPMGDITYKGFNQPVSTYRLQGKTTAPKVFQQKLVGRELELSQLVEFARPLFARQRAGVAWVYGEAGMGKSHLSYALSQAFGSQIRWIFGQSDPILRQAFNPFIYFLRRYFNQSAEATESKNKANFAQKLQDLLTDLTQIPDTEYLHDELARTRSFLGSLLDLHWSDSLYEQLDAKGRYQNIMIAITVLLRSECQRQPVILELEDGHWLDEASHELLTILTRQIRDVPLLILITSRYTDDGFQPKYALDPEIPVLTLELTALTAIAIQQLAQNILSIPISDTLQIILMEKTQANPFFVQQILYYLQENALLQIRTTAGQMVATLATDGFKLPTTLNSLLVARLDRLTPQVKEVVQTAAVLGSEFEPRLLSRMLKRDITAEMIIADQEQIWSSLNKLQYIFKHVLLRDAAYEMQLRVQLQKLHYLAAIVGEQLYANQLPTYYSLLAHHYEEAYLWGQLAAKEKASYYLWQAGQQALDNFGNAAAIDYFSRMLAITSDNDLSTRYDLYLAREKAYHMQGDRLAQNQELETLIPLVTRLGSVEQAVVALRRATYIEVTSDYPLSITVAQAAIALAQQVNKDDLMAQGHVVWGLALYHQAQYPEAIAQLETGVQLSQQVKATETTMQCWRSLGKVANAQGEYETARNYFLQALPLARQLGDRPHEGRLLLDLGISDWEQGAYQRADVYLRQSLALSRTTGDRLAAATSLRNMGIVAYFQGQYDRAIEYYEQSLVISQEIGDRMGTGNTLNALGLVANDQGQYGKATGYLEQGLAITQEIGDRATEGKILTNLGLVVKRRGQLNKMLAYFKQSLAISREIGNRSVECMILNNLGFETLDHGRYDQATGYLEQSLLIAQEIGDQRAQCMTLNNLGLIVYEQGWYDEAARYYEQSLLISQEIGNRLEEGSTLNSLGVLFMARTHFSQAQTCYQQALTIYQDIHQPHSLVMVWAGLAVVAMKQGEVETAESYASQLLAALTEHLVVNEYNTYYLMWQVFQWLALPQADEVLAMAARDIQMYLDNISDPQAQAVYLARPHLQPLWDAWQAKQGF